MSRARKKTIPFRFGDKHKAYIRECDKCTYNIAEGAVRAGKTIDNVFAFAHALKASKDRLHIATGSTMANAKLNIGDANGFGLEYIFRGQCKWSKYRDNDALIIKGPATGNREKIVIFAGGAKADSYKKIRGNSYGMWIATEINLHHETFIKEVFNRTVAAHDRRFFWDLNPTQPRHPIYTQYIDKYREKAEKGELLGGCNYEAFTLNDNATISDTRKEEIKSQYEPGSIWYKRDILGERIAAEGAIYTQIIEHLEKYEGSIEPGELDEIAIGVDFGGNKSGHAFVARGYENDYENLWALASRRIMAGPEGSIDPVELNRELLRFIDFVENKYGNVDYVYWDNAESVLGASIRNAIGEKYPDIIVRPARKIAIIDRIKALIKLIAQERFYITEDCESLKEALHDAVWDSKKTDDVRLDDNTSDIDSLDAFEYTFERDIKRLVREY